MFVFKWIGILASLQLRHGVDKGIVFMKYVMLVCLTDGS